MARTSKLAVLLSTLSSLAFAAPASAQDDPAPGSQTAEEPADPGNAVIVTGTRRTDRTVADSPVPVDVIGDRGDRQFRPDRDQQDPQQPRPLVQLPAALDRRRHRRASPGHAARPQPRPDAGAGQRQAPARFGAAQHQRHGRPRQRRRRPQPHPRPRHPAHRGAARRRLLAIWLGRDRRRDQHPAAQRQPWRPRDRDLRPLRDHARRRRQHHRPADQRAASPSSIPPTTASSPPPATASATPSDGAIWTIGANFGLPIGERLRQPHRRISRPQPDQPRRLRPPAQLQPPDRRVRPARADLRPARIPLRRRRDRGLSTSSSTPACRSAATGSSTASAPTAIATASAPPITATRTPPPTATSARSLPGQTPTAANFVPLTPDGFLPFIDTDLEDYAGTGRRPRRDRRLERRFLGRLRP